MGKRGPSSAPTSLKLVRGERKDRINDDEPIAPDGPPDPIDDLTPEVRAVWDYTLKQLASMHLATPADRDALIAYCEAVVTHRRASKLLAQSNVLVPGWASNRRVAVKNPAVQVQRDAAVLIRLLGREFGLTPSGRSDIRMGRGSNNAGSSPERLLS